MNTHIDSLQLKRIFYHQLMRHARTHINSQPLAELLTSWRFGDSQLPLRLGLSRRSFRNLHRYHFGFAPPDDECEYGQPRYQRTDLLNLLKNNARDNSPSVRWVTELIATACLANNHLWQDLGLWSRDSLNTLMTYNFPALAERNDQDMKWKKFLSRELCQQGDVYVCKAPTCDECCDYDDCFGPE